MSGDIELAQTGAVATLTLRNGRLNIMTTSMREQLLAVMQKLAENDSVRAIVIRGSDTAFSAGSDVHEFPRSGSAGEELARMELACNAAVRSVPQPVIAAIEGFALGGGAELALACDLRVASTAAKFGFPEVGLGVYPGDCTQFLPRLVGLGRAKRLLLLGSPVDAEEAERAGLVDILTDPGKACDRSVEIAQTLAGYPVASVRAIKASLDEAWGPDLDMSRLHAERMVELFATDDAQEAVQAFLEKRPPSFAQARDEESVPALRRQA
jgi:enoyl-CoA hydratase